MFRTEPFLVIGGCCFLVAAAVIFTLPARAGVNAPPQRLDAAVELALTTGTPSGGSSGNHSNRSGRAPARTTPSTAPGAREGAVARAPGTT